MSIGSSGSGDYIGAPQQYPLKNHPDADSFTQTTRQDMGIVKDSLDISFTQLGGDPRKNYQANPNRPNMPPLEQIRTGNPENALRSDAWKEEFSALLMSLPEDIRNQLIAESLLPADQRSSNLLALENVLITTAQGLGQVAYANQKLNLSEKALSELDPSFILRTSFFQEMGPKSVEGLISDSATIYATVVNHLVSMSANEPLRDNMMNFIHQINDAINTLNLLQTDTSQELTAKKSWLAEYVQNISNQTFADNELFLLSDHLKALSSVTAAFALDEASSALTLSFALALTASSQEESESGIFGPKINQFFKKFTEAIVNQTEQTVDAAKTYYLEIMTKALTALLAGIATVMAQQGFGQQVRSRDETVQAEYRDFELKLSLITAANTRFANQVFERVGRGAGLSEPAQKLLGNSFSTVAFMFALLLVSQNNEKQFNDYLLAIVHPFSQNLREIGAAISEQVETGANRSSATVQLHSFVQQALLALDREDPAQFKEIVKESLASLGISYDALMQDLNEFNAFAQGIGDQITAANADQRPNTGISQIA